MEQVEFIMENETPIRIDSALVELLPDFTRSAFARLITEGNVMVNLKPVCMS